MMLNMDSLQQTTLEADFVVRFQYKVHFTRGLLDQGNPLLANILGSHCSSPRTEPGQGVEGEPGEPFEQSPDFLCVLDETFARHHPDFSVNLKEYSHLYGLNLLADPLLLPGGEQSKNDLSYAGQVVELIHRNGLDRHSTVLAVGGGALLDTAGYAAAVAHRGVKLIRVPTTVLSQNDSGIGVKNGVNLFGKKNFIGSFAPPAAVINDSRLLSTLESRDWLAGVAEAIKVALIKDSDFFDYIQNNTSALIARDHSVMERIIHRCASLHLEHISRGGDPFESGSSRPLDFGHWVGHKLEQLSGFELRHGEAVAQGMAFDAVYSAFAGLLSFPEADRILEVLERLGFSGGNDYATLLHSPDENGQPVILSGLREFQEHLGGRLTIMLLQKIGQGVDVHQIDHLLVEKALEYLRNRRNHVYLE